MSSYLTSSVIRNCNQLLKCFKSEQLITTFKELSCHNAVHAIELIFSMVRHAKVEQHLVEYSCIPNKPIKEVYHLFTETTDTIFSIIEEQVMRERPTAR